MAPEAMAHRLLWRMVECLRERMACRETQLEARAEDMSDPVTKRVEMALIRYNPKITGMEVRRGPDCRPRRSGGEMGMEDREGDDGTQKKENPADMRAGRVYGFAARGDVRKGTGGKGTAAAPVA